eukprot:gene28516-34425_t
MFYSPVYLFEFLLLVLVQASFVACQDRSWTSTINLPDEFSSSNSVSVDHGSDFIYVAGIATDDVFGQTNAGQGDILLLKYDDEGSILWTRLAGTAAYDEATAVTVDSSSGNVYVTGYVAGSLLGQTYVDSTDIVLLKYDSDGDIQWARLAGSTGADQGNGVAVDVSTGDIYVAGVAAGSINGETFDAGSDLVLLKYTSAGTLLWTRMVGTAGYDRASGVLVHASTGAVYVCGQVGGSVDGETYTGGADMLLMRVAVDSAGTVFVAGSVSGDAAGVTAVAGQDLFLMSFAGNGTRLWTVIDGTSGDDYASGVAVDSSAALSLRSIAVLSRPPINQAFVKRPFPMRPSHNLDLFVL